MVSALKRRWAGVLPVVALFVLILSSLYFMSNAAQNPNSFGHWYLGLLIFNASLMLVLLILILVRLGRLIRGLLNRQEGARLTWRLVLAFSFVAIVPVVIVYAFSSRFISSGIDNWLDVSVEESMEDALQLGRASLEFRKTRHLQDTQVLVPELQGMDEMVISLELDDFRQQLEASQLTVLGANNRIIGSSTSSADLSIPRFPSREVMLKLNEGQDYVGIEPDADGDLQIRVVTRFAPQTPGFEPKILLAVFPVPDSVSLLANRIEQSYDDYKGLVYLREPLKQSFSITLLLVLLLTTLFALWAAFYISRKILHPVVELAGATREVAKGNYEQRLPVIGHDELGFLVASFNQMTSGIKQAREIAEQNHRLAESQRNYLETVLGHLSSGVMALDEQQRLRTANEVADRVFETNKPLSSYAGQRLVDVAEKEPLLQRFLEQVSEPLAGDASDWEAECTLFGEEGRKLLLSRGVVLSSEHLQEVGWVIVFDDVTALITAQRDAAWGEVARRLAHEIKNPLTPIQLSAERIEYRLSADLPPDKRDLLERATRTIVQQVESMRDMVNEFRDYASAPQIQPEDLDLNRLIEGVVELYQGNRRGLAVVADLDEKMPVVSADAGQIRQVLHNLIKNAIEAIGEEDGRVLVTTHYADVSQNHHLEVAVSDTGGGIKPELLGNLFEPYVTDKHKGTGLGLAIVKKIVEQHGGLVKAENVPEQGARVVIRLPERHHPANEPDAELLTSKLERREPV